MLRSSFRLDATQKNLVVGVGAALLGLVALTAACLAVYQHWLPSAEASSSVWALILIASAVGWGTLLDRALFGRARADIGLRAVWGVGFLISLGGLLMLVHLAKAKALAGLVVIGAAIPFVLGLHRSGELGARLRAGARRFVLHGVFGPSLVVLLTLGLIQLMWTGGGSEPNPNDDFLAYFEFPHRILQTGTLFSPYSLRRMTAYGGQSLLHAMHILIGTPEPSMGIVDISVAPFVLLLAILFIPGKARRSVLLPLTACLVLAVHLSRFNGGGYLTGAVLFFGMWRTLAAGSSPRYWVVVGVLAAAASSLRQSYLAAVAAFLTVASVGQALTVLRAHGFSAWRAGLLPALWMGAGYAGGMLSWVVMSYQSTGAFVFPLSKGHYVPAYELFRALPIGRKLAFIVTNFGYLDRHPTAPILVLAVPFLLAARRPGTVALLSSVASYVLGGLILYLAYQASTPWDLHRYSFAFIFAALLAIGVHAAIVSGSGVRAQARARSTVGPWLVGAALILHLVIARGELMARFNKTRDFGYGEAFASGPRWHPAPPDPIAQKLQVSVPAGAAIAMMVDEPYRFDFGRNPIFNLDMVGAVSAPPRIAYERGGEVVAEQFLARGIRYLIIVASESSRSLYRRDTWQRHANGDDLPVWQWTARFYLDAFNAFDALRASRVHLCDAGDNYVLDLMTPAAR